MIRTRQPMRLGMLALVVSACLSVGECWASGATFEITAPGSNLRAVVGEFDVPRFTAQVKVGQVITLVSQGKILPRGAAPQPSAGEAGTWIFDDEKLEIDATEGKFDKTQIAITLKAVQPGETRVRFVGKILGYPHKFDVNLIVTK
ncbi:hypothetical protein [Tuwongella immobilis]|uniref:Uncharacterized protein n=1 Tax=Tuwongella immobilis TaxID=692036 RepID=A0A6C2YRZ2_9BACT|nr:hypothetical protein [Tuwongella immobilis]VIP04246.1 unnamed protein product [Tuwongella immobilis]VTS05855.1 unnamed protein product [Tuwongella immobilis]